MLERGKLIALKHFVHWNGKNVFCLSKTLDELVNKEKW